jgi:hydrogenase expression/formation protein HypC
MCLGIPMKIVSIDTPDNGVVDLDGARSTINLSLVEYPKEGEYVIVHAGYAIEKLDTTEADTRIEMFEDLEREWKESGTA